MPYQTEWVNLESVTIFSRAKPAPRELETLIGLLQEEDVGVAVVVHQQDRLHTSL
jgi:hypothetical protein